MMKVPAGGPSRPPPDERSIIIDMGDNVHSQVERLLAHVLRLVLLHVDGGGVVVERPQAGLLA